MTIHIVFPFFTSLIGSLVLTWCLVEIGRRFNFVSVPTKERWHQTPTPWLGGIGIVLSMTFAIGVSSFAVRNFSLDWKLLAAPGFVFLIGIIDDRTPLTPTVKFLGQLIPAVFLVFVGGYMIVFFPWPVLNILLTIFWLVGITNAVNLIDNMDGIAGGVSLIAALFLAYFSFQSNSRGLLVVSIALAGSLVGFLKFNFPPAKIFMGDNGSLFLGFLLAELAVARRTTASNVLSVLGVPILVFLMPILDTVLVSVTRIMRWQSPFDGGKDHTSHRLVNFGLGERQAAIIIYISALISGVVGVIAESWNYELGLVVVPVFLIAMAMITAYLGRVQLVVDKIENHERAAHRQMVMVAGNRILVLLLDLCIVAFGYYLSYWLWYGFNMTKESVQLYMQSCPAALLSLYSVGFAVGLYRNSWGKYGRGDLLRQLTTAVFSSLLLYGAVALMSASNYPLGVFFLYSGILFLGLLITRSAFPMLDQLRAMFFGNSNLKR